MTETQAKTLTQTPADILTLQSDWVRTGKYEPLGVMMKMSIGDSARFTPPAGDALFDLHGRFIDFRRCMMPIALSLDAQGMLLVTAPLLRQSCPNCAAKGKTAQFLSSGQSTVVCPDCLKAFTQPPEVKLPDLPDPNWVPEKFSQDEIEGRAPRDPKKIFPRMLPQYLANRCEKDGTRPGLLEGTDYMMFQPVVRIAFQRMMPSTGQLTAAVGLIDCIANDEGKEACFLVNYRTGECHFFGGKYLIAVKS